MRVDYLIIGGGIAGVSAAEAIRSVDSNATICVIGDESHALYSRVLLPKYAEGIVPRSKVFLRDASHAEDRRIDMYSGVSVLSLHSDEHSVVLSDGRTIGYGKALIATGGRPKPLPCPVDSDISVSMFQTLEDADALLSMTQGRAAVLGGSFIALELATVFSRHGLDTSVFMRGDGFFSRTLDAESRMRITDEVRRNGVRIIPHTSPIGITSDSSSAARIDFDDGSTAIFDHIGAGMGIHRNTTFLSGSGIRVDSGVVVDAYLQTSHPDVFAAGDVAEFPDPFTGTLRTVGVWQSAMFQGRVAGLNMAGQMQPFSQLITYAIPCFGLPLTFVGSTEEPADDIVVLANDDRVLQLRFLGGRLIGVTCAGKYRERTVVTDAINTRRVFSSDDLRTIRHSGIFS